MGGAAAVSMWPQAHRLPTGMSPFEEVDLTPLLLELKLRRLNSRKTARPIRHSEVAERMGVHKTFVGRLESGKRSLRNLPGEQLWHFLTGYRYTPLEIEGIVSRYRLNTPPQLLELRAAESGMVTVMDEGGVSRPTTPAPVEVPAAWILDYDPGEVTIRWVKPGDLGTQRAKLEARPGTALTLSASEEPVEGSLVIVRSGDVQVLATWPLTRDWATPYDPDTDEAPAPVHAGMPIVAVVVSSTRPHPTKRGQES